MPLSEIAGLDDYQLAFIYFRPRDEHGSLVEMEVEGKEKPVDPGRIKKPVGYKEMYWHMGQARNWTEEQIEKGWQEYLKKEPGLAKILERKARRRGRPK